MASSPSEELLPKIRQEKKAARNNQDQSRLQCLTQLEGSAKQEETNVTKPLAANLTKASKGRATGPQVQQAQKKSTAERTATEQVGKKVDRWHDSQ